MKKVKNVLASLLSMAIILGICSYIAAEPPLTPPFEKEDRFYVMEDFGWDAMISSDGELVIIIDDETPVFFEDDTDVRGRLEEDQTLMGVLDGRKLIITYSVTTRSMPPQTAPEKIVVLFEEIMPLPGDVIGIVPPIYEFDQDESNQISEVNELNGEIVVFGEIIAAPKPYHITNNEGARVVMVPLRAIAEKLGFDVNWDAQTRGIRIGVATNLWIDKDEYIVSRMAPVELGTAPELTGDITYVPISFFREVITGYEIDTIEGQVVIDSE